jgi:hypothetical protein
VKVEWGIRYEHHGDPTMDNPGGVTTISHPVSTEWRALTAVSAGIPRSGTGHRVIRREVTEWEEVK